MTGGAGYIGSVATEVLLEAGYDVVVFDDVSQGHREAVPAGADLVEGNLLDAEAIERAFASHPSLEGILHFASRSLVGQSMTQPELYLRDNVAAGMNLLAAAARHNVGKFVLSSTANLFGDPKRIPISEDEEIAPGSPYGEAKWWLERALHWYERISGLQYMALRYFNAAGASVDRRFA